MGMFCRINSGPRQLDQMAVPLVRQVGPPTVIHRHPTPLAGQRCQNALSLICCGGIAPHWAAEQVLVFHPQGITKQRPAKLKRLQAVGRVYASSKTQVRTSLGSGTFMAAFLVGCDAAIVPSLRRRRRPLLQAVSRAGGGAEHAALTLRP